MGGFLDVRAQRFLRWALTGLCLSASLNSHATSPVLGFENSADWYAEQTSVHPEFNTKSEGAAALAVPMTGYTRVLSRSIETAEVVVPVDLQFLWVDLRIPANHSGYLGNMEPIIRIPDAGIWWQPLPAVDLSNAPRDQFQTHRFELPPSVIDALKTANQFTLYFNLNAAGGGSPWLLDNARFSLDAAQGSPQEPEGPDQNTDPDTQPNASSAPPADQPAGIDLGNAGTFNAFVFENFTGQHSDIQGRLFAGGNVDLNGYSVGDQLGPDLAGDVLVAGGNVRYPTGTVYYGNILAAGSTDEVGAPVRNGLNPGATIKSNATLPFDVNGARLHLETLSANLTTLEANGTVDNMWGGLYLHGDGSSELQVFNLNGNDVVNAHTFSVDGIPAGAHVVININGSHTGLTNMELNALAAHRERTLFNFHEASSLQFSGIGIHGSVLAPYAQIHNPQGVINGNLVATAWNGQMQFNHAPFQPYDGVNFDPQNPPQISFASPANNALVNTSQPTLVLDYSDPDDNAAPATLALTVDGAALNAACTHDNGQATCTPDAIADGAHEFTALIADDTGLMSPVATLNLTIDTTPTPIEFTSPEQGSRIGNNTPSIEVVFGEDLSGANLETFTLSGSASGITFTCDVQTTGATCTPDSALPDGAQTLTATITDAAGNPSAPAVVNFEIDTAPPVIVVTDPPNNSQTFAANTVLVGTISEPAELVINGEPVAVDEQLRFTYPSALVFGPNLWTLTATDPAGNSGQLQHTVIRNRSIPAIGSQPVTSIQAGEEYRYSVSATDPDPSDTLTYSLTAAPAGMTIVPESGLIIWPTNSSLEGEHAVTIVVTDNNGDTDTQNFSITVFVENRAPTAEGQQAQTDENIAIDLNLSGADPDGDSITYRIVEGPSNGTLSGEAPNLTYLPNAFYEGPDAFVFVTDDGELQSEQATVAIEVIGQGNNPPRITSEAISEHVLKPDSGEPEILDVRNWQVATLADDGGPAPNWVVDATGTVATQTLNARPSAFVSPTPFVNSRIDGTWRVNTNSDDDYIGFVFGYQDPQHFYVFVWKRNDQGLGRRGMQVLLFDGDEASSSSTFGITNIDLLYANRIAWNHRTDYDFSLSFQPGIISITVGQNGTVLDSFTVNDSTYVDGAFGFFNWSQEQVQYSGFAAERLANRVYLYPVVAEDPDGDEITYRLLDAPEGMSINPETGAITWETDEANLGNFPVTIEVEDEFGATDRQSYELVVTNDAPVFVGQPNSIAYVDELYSDSLTAFDPNPADPLTYSLLEAPAGMALEPATGRLQWQPVESDLGTHPVSVEVVDSQGRSDTQDYVLTVERRPDNESPEFSSQPPLVATVGRRYVYTPQAVDPDGDTVEYGLVGDLPYHMQIFDGTNVTWRPTADQVTDWTVTVDAQDGKGGVAEQTFTIRVQDLENNNPPQIDSQPVTDADIGQLYQYPVQASDADGDVLSYQLTDAPDGMTIDAAGLIQWTPDANDIGLHDVTLLVDDGRGGYAESSYTLAVRDPAANRGPVITSSPVTQAQPGSAYVYQVIVNDPDGDALSYQLTNAPTGMAVDGDGRITWTPAANQAGLHGVSLEVSDGRGGVARQSYSIQVQTAGEPDPGNASPTISSSPPTSVEIGQTYSYAVIASDPDGDTLNYSLLQAPPGMQIDTVGNINWQPVENDLGNHPVRVQVADGRGGAAQQSYTITVFNEGQPPPANRSPSIDSLPPITAQVGFDYQYAIAASDPDGDTLNYSLIQGPAGMAVDANGLLTWAPDNAGNRSIRIRVDDGQSFVEQGWTLNVQPAPGNEAPSINSQPPTTAKVGFEYRYGIAASDPDGDALNYTLVQGPAGMAVDANGLVTWTPDSVGNRSIRVRVDDGQSFVEQGWTLRVQPADQALTAEIIVSPQPAAPNEEILISVFVDGAAGNVNVQAALDGAPLALDGARQARVSFDAPGAHTLEVTASDDFDSVTETAEFVVRDPNDTEGPQVDLTTPANLTEITAPADILGLVQADDLLDWRLSYRLRGEQAQTLLAEGTTPFTESAIAEFDPTLLTNGLYEITLTARDQSLNQTRDSLVVTVDGQMKVGPFQVAFEDLNIPTSGIPLVLTRSYDSKDRNRDSAFGKGWSVDYQSLRLQQSQALGRDWVLNERRRGFVTEFCVQPVRSPIVNITLPDGDTERFVARAQPECNDFQPILDVAIVMEPLSNRGFKLEADTQSINRLINGNLADPGEPDVPVDGQDYTLTTPEGFIYDLDPAFGTESVTDPNGNTVIYNDNAITHSSGLSFTLTRDAAGRITEVTDPNGAALVYEYDANGQLISVLDREGNQTEYSYDANGNLTQITDPTHTPVIDNAYDADGRLQTQTDAAGLSVGFTYDIPGRQQIVRDRNGNATLYIYDDRGNVISETNALGETITRTYDGDNLITQTNPLGQTTSFTYDAQDNQISETDALGNTTTSSYDSGNRLLTLIGPDGTLQVTNQYNAFGLPTSVSDALGNTTQFTYNEFGDLLSITDALGQVTTSTYNDKGYKTSETKPNGQRTDWTHDNNGNPLTETVTVNRPDGSTQQRVTRFEYDGEGRVLQTTHPDASTTRTQYDANGNPIAETDALGRTTETEYDGNGQPITVTHPDGSTTSTQYDGNGNVTQTTDQSGRRTTNAYDAANRLTQSAIAVGTSDEAVTTSSFDAAGRLSQTTDANGNTTTNTYDAAGRRTSTTDALGNITRFEYDGEGQTTAEIDPNGNRTSYTLDANGRRTVTTYADGSRTQTQYDALGRRIAHTDELGQTTHFEYTPDNQLAAVINPLNERTEYTYDSNGNKLSQTDAEGRTTTWTYDSLDRPTARTLPLGQTETHQYDVAGRRTQSSDFNGNTITYSYDSLDRETQRTYTDGTRITTSYTPTGQISSATRFDAGNPAGLTTTYAYDHQDRLTQTTDPFGNSISYAYDANGNRTAQTKLGQTTTYQYDAANRLTTVAAPEGTTTYGYDATGNQTQTDRANGVSTISEYDSRNWLTRTAQMETGGTILADSQYILAANGQRLSETNADGTVSSYTYDGASKLIESIVTDTADNTQTTRWTFDAAGNRLTETKDGTTTTYTVDANDRLTQASDGTTTTTYSYDDQGNLLSETENGTQTATYSYSGDHKLMQSTANGQSASYVYDAADNRIGQTTGGSTARYLIDPNFAFAQVVAELDGSNTPTTLYSIGNQRISQTDTLSGQTHYLHQDGLGSTRLITDETGTDIAQYRYSQYGEIAEQDGSGSSDFLFAGEQRDQATGNYYLRARYYDPSQGRLTQFDPFIGFDNRPITLNKYLYGNGDPINTVDPSGNFGLASIGASLNSRAILANSANVVVRRRLLQRVITETLRAPRVAAKFARECRRNPRRCKLETNLLVHGNNIPQTTQHVLDAQTGNGSNLIHAPLFLNRASPSSRSFISGSRECNPSVRVRASIRQSGPVACDEYPFNSTSQGGRQNYPAVVSLRFTALAEAPQQGGLISGFYRACRVGKVERQGVRKSRFLTVGIPTVPSFFVCRGRR